MSRIVNFRRAAHAVAIAASVVVVLAPMSALGGQGSPGLADRAPAPGTLFAASDDGRLATLDPTTLTLEVWGTDGRRLANRTVPPPEKGGSPTGVALLGSRTLVAFARDDQPAHTCVLLEIAGDAPAVTFVGGEVPSRLFAGPTGWIFERLAPGDEPTLEAFAADGTYLGRMAPPADPVAQAREAFADPSYAFLRLVAVDGKLWALPSFAYQLWCREEGGQWTDQIVPPDLRVTARYVEGEAARKRMLERAESMPASEAQRLRDRVAWTREIGLNVKSYATAVRGAVGFGKSLAVLAEPHPEAEDGACRIDMWDLGKRRPLASRAVAGPCPALVALGPEGLWLLGNGRLVRVDPPTPSGDRSPGGAP